VKKVSIKKAAAVIMKAAYLHASAKGTLPAHARQVMYAAGRISLTRLRRFDRLWLLKSGFFSKKALINERPVSPGTAAVPT